jgi:hypothetical protein
MFKMNTRIIKLIKLVATRPNFIIHPRAGPVLVERQYICPRCQVKVRVGGLCVLCYMDTANDTDAD